ncbi:hypothetical protein IscW_ISCW007392, partial [Ixodes scapularis]
PEKEKKNALQEEKRDAEGPERAIVAKLQLAIRTTGVRVAKKKKEETTRNKERKSDRGRPTGRSRKKKEETTRKKQRKSDRGRPTGSSITRTNCTTRNTHRLRSHA